MASKSENSNDSLADFYLTAGQKSGIESHAIGVYPLECCGILIGRDFEGHRVIEQVEPVQNSFESSEKHRRFSIDSLTLLRAEKQCKAGQSVIGFYHSHPDHPAKPSEFDREHAWPFYSYLIVSIVKSAAEEMTSWVLIESSGQFVQQRLVLV